MSQESCSIQGRPVIENLLELVTSSRDSKLSMDSHTTVLNIKNACPQEIDRDMEHPHRQLHVDPSWPM